MKIRVSRSAKADLQRIDSWLSRVDGLLADAAQTAIAERISLLRTYPAIGSPLSGNRRKLNENRFGYRIVYRVQGDEIDILRIHHQREDWR